MIIWINLQEKLNSKYDAIKEASEDEYHTGLNFQMLTYLTRELKGFVEYVEQNFKPAELFPAIHRHTRDLASFKRGSISNNVAKHMTVMKLLLHLRTTHKDDKILVFSHSVVYLRRLF